MNAGPENAATNPADDSPAYRSCVASDLESLLKRPVAADFQSLCDASDGVADVFKFIHRKGSLSPQECVDALRVDQYRQYGQESAIPAETYCAFLRNRYGVSSGEIPWQIIAGEFLLALKKNDSSRGPLLQRFTSRFPEYRSQLTELANGDDLPETLMVDPTRSLASELEPTAAALTPTQPHLPAGLVADPNATRLDVDDAGDPDQSSLAFDPGSFVHNQSSLLGGTEPFSRLPPIILKKIEEKLVERRFHTDDHLIREGDPGDGLYFLVDGRVSIRSSGDREMNQEIARCGPGSILGEMALLTDQPRTANVVAVTDVLARFLPVSLFQQLASEYPVIGQVLTQLLAQRLGQQEHDALSGKKFGRYRITQRLGRGGMAIVYQAQDEQTDSTVALKMMSHRLVYDANALKLFQSEARLIEAFKHQNIVRMLGRFKAFRSFFIVLEFCDGVSLDQKIRTEGPLDESEFRRVMSQLASALAYAHSRGIVHRDIKPSNVILTSSGDIKLMDFGLAKPVDNGESASSRLISGTPRFMAPEQLLGDRTDTQADLFSLGCTAWKLLTGSDLITDTRLTDIEERHRNWQAPDVSHFSPETGRFLTACLQVDPENRRVDLDEVSGWAQTDSA